MWYHIFNVHISELILKYIINKEKIEKIGVDVGSCDWYYM